MGDSITFGSNMNPTPPQELGIKTGRAVLNEGVPGATAADIYANYLSTVRGKGYQQLVYFGGINSITADLSAAQVWADIQQTLDAARGDGLRVTVCTITPFHNSSFYTAARETVRTTVNASIASWCTGKSEVTCVDTSAHFSDGASPPNLLAIYDRGDGLHLNQAGSTELGDYVQSTSTAFH